MAPRIGARKNKKFKAVSTAPSFNKTPVGPSTPPVPYPVYQDLSVSVGTVNTVHFNSDAAYVLGQSSQPTCIGDAPGVALGVKSGTVSGEVKPVLGSSTVNVGGDPIIREGDPCLLQGGNCPGIYVTQPDPSGTISEGELGPAGDLAIVPETKIEAEAAKGSELWHQAGGFLGGAYSAGKDMVVGLEHMVVHPVETAKGLYQAGPTGIAKAFAKPYQEAWATGEYGKALGRGLVDVGSLLIPAAGQTGKVGELGKIGELGEAGKVGKVSKLAEVDELARGAEVSRSGELGTAGELARPGEVASGSELAKASEAGGTGAGNGTRIVGQGLPPEPPPPGLAYRIDLPDHLAGPDGFKAGKLHGTHNMDAALEALKTKKPKYSMTPTAVKGIYELRYEYFDPIKGKAVKAVKTVYDPKIYSDGVMLEMAQKAGAKGFASHHRAPAPYFDVTQDGVKFRVYINRDANTGAPYVGNVHPVK